MVLSLNEDAGVARRGDIADAEDRIAQRIESGDIISPDLTPRGVVLAGGTNHCPNSDVNFSTEAATVPGTLPATPGDTNQEAYRFYWVERGANVVLDAAHALKAVGHTLYAGNEAINTGLPIWNRLTGWVEMGSVGTQYDIVVQLLNKVVGPGEHWFFLFRCVSLNAALVPDDVQAFGGLWIKTATYEGWAKGDPFDLRYEVEGAAGAQSIEYRALAETDSGFAILSNVLTVPNAPNVLSFGDYVKLFYSAGPGFVKFTIYKKVAGVYTRVHEVRNSTDLQFNDIGAVGIAEAGWPVESDDRPLAYAQSSTLRVGEFNGASQLNELHILIPGTYQSQLTDDAGQFLRFSVLGATGVDRHLSLDKFWWSTTLNEWAPDPAIRFSDGSVALQSVSPSSGNPGLGGVYEPPEPGDGGGPCVLTRMPVKSRTGRRYSYRRYDSIRIGDEIKGEFRLPYLAMRKPGGTASEWIEIVTKNGIKYECTPGHRMVRSLWPRKYVQARHVVAGETKLMGETRGRNVATLVVSKRLIPKPCEVGTLILRHTGGQVADGRGLYLAGHSKKRDRGLYSSNVKREFDLAT